MNRKLMVTVWIGVLGLSVIMLGCPKKKPAPAPVDTETTTVSPAEDVARPTAPSTQADKTPDPLAGDIVEAMEYAYQQGLLGDVYFDFDKYELKTESRERLAKNAEFLKAHPEFTFTIEGHCDERGTNDYNLALGDRRASASSNYLTSLGARMDNIKTISFGEERPVCTVATESCWWRNRRAHFVITGRS
ncbi:MAG: peptidoglycan-associated lipoprotein Pal [Thermoanaerobaculia bacterium]